MDDVTKEDLAKYRARWEVRRNALSAIRATLPRRDAKVVEEAMQWAEESPTALYVTAEMLATAFYGAETKEALEAAWAEELHGVSLFHLPFLLQDWLAKDKALRIALAALLDFDNIPASPQADYWKRYAGEDITDLIALALGHKPMADDEDAPDLLRRVFVWGQDEDPSAELDENGEPVKKAKPCTLTIPMAFEDEEGNKR